MISMFERFTWELHATFLRNHNTRLQRTPSRRQLPAGARIPGRHNCQKHGALHPIWGATPEQKRCIAYGSGAAPQHTRTNAELANRTTPRHNQQPSQHPVHKTSPGHASPVSIPRAESQDADASDEVLLLHVLHGEPPEGDPPVEGDETVEQSRRDCDRRGDARDRQA